MNLIYTYYGRFIEVHVGLLSGTHTMEAAVVDRQLLAVAHFSGGSEAEYFYGSDAVEYLQPN